MDDLVTGDTSKLILGVDFDTEYDNIATAVATKIDSTDIASQAEAEAGVVTNKVMNAPRMAQYADANAGALGDIQDLTDPGGTRLLIWDDSDSAVEWATLGNGLTLTRPGTGETVSTIAPIFTGLNDEPAVAVGDFLAVYDVDAGSHKKLDVGNRGGVLAGGWTIYDKTADEAVTSSVTLQDDNHITGISLDTGSQYYAFECLLLIDMASATPDIKWQWIFDNAPSIFKYSYQHVDTVPGGDYQPDGTVEQNRALAAQMSIIRMFGVIKTGASTSTLKLQWAQQNSNASPTTLKLGSFARVLKLS
jgi:hypothetical protein